MNKKKMKRCVYKNALLNINQIKPDTKTIRNAFND